MTFKALSRTGAILAALLSSACSTAFNGPENAITVAQQHPIAVDSQVVTLTIDSDVTTDDLSTVDASRLKAFAREYSRKGHGAITITAPSGGGSDLDGQEAAADIRRVLYEAGIPWSSISGATYRTGDANSQQLIISFAKFVATPSECGDWSGLRINDYGNLRSPNFGCATMNNYAAMISDPRDLIEPAPEGPADTAARLRALEAYRAGETTASQRDDTIEALVSN
ncbi:MAG: CpaD family pilus assembly protein [Pseudomonadota bacterium]